MNKNFGKVGTQARNEKLKSQYNWIIAEPYYDVMLQNGSSGKTKENITLREFKRRVDEGQTIKQMRDDGVSKHVIQFFSNFVQGKINLTKDEFEVHYNNGEPLNAIAKEFNISREDITYLRQLYDIKRKGATFQKRKKNDVSLTYFQKQLIYGSLMGDAKRQHTQFNSSVGFVHGGPQKEYLKWKASMLYNLVSENALKCYSAYDERYGKEYDSWRFYTIANTDVENILNQFYKDGNKKVTLDILDQMETEAVAVWFMDDGNTYWRDIDKQKGKNPSPEIKFCTDSFSIEENQMICEWLKKKYEIYSHVGKHHKKDGVLPRVVIDASSVYDFLSLIRPHVIPSMLYKVDYEAWKKLKSENKYLKL